MLAPWVISHFPAHRVYTEAWGGAGSVLMRKPRAKLVEVYNDLDGEVVGLFRLLRDPIQAAELARQLALTPFARDEFVESYVPASGIEQARRTIIRSFMGFGSDSASGAVTGFRANGNRQTAHPAKDWGNYPAAITSFCERLTGVVIENRPAMEIVRQHDGPQTLHYCDPPYVHETRSSAVCRIGKGYRHEMGEQDHRDMATVLRACVGMVVLSGYASPLYDELFSDWKKAVRPALADGGLARTEVLWMNRAAVEGLARSTGQTKLFAEVS